jgi:hypothetical protein
MNQKFGKQASRLLKPNSHQPHTCSVSIIHSIPISLTYALFCLPLCSLQAHASSEFPKSTLMQSLLACTLPACTAHWHTLSVCHTPCANFEQGVLLFLNLEQHLCKNALGGALPARSTPINMRDFPGAIHINTHEHIHKHKPKHKTHTHTRAQHTHIIITTRYTPAHLPFFLGQPPLCAHALCRQRQWVRMGRAL